MGVASFVLGLLSLILFCVPCLNWVLAILGFIFGIIGAAKKTGSRGLAVAGLVLSIITIVINIGSVVASFLLYGSYDIMSILNDIMMY